MNDDKVARRIAKLLRLAEHPNTPEGERQNATAQAAALMERYAITELMIARASGQPVTETPTKREYAYDGIYSFADASLHWNVSCAMGVKSIRVKLGGSKIKMYVVGFPSDLQRYDVIITSLLLQRSAALSLYLVEQRTVWSLMSPSEKYNAKRSFAVGFGVGAAEKIKLTVQRVHREAGSGAEIVLADRSQVVASHFQSLFPRAKKATRVVLTGSYERGKVAGSSADVGGARIGGSRPALTSETNT